MRSNNKLNSPERLEALLQNSGLLSDLKTCGILSSRDASDEVEIIKMILLKKQKAYIDKVHKYKITPPSEKDPRWKTHIPAPDTKEKRIKISKTDEYEFFSTLYDFYMGIEPKKKKHPTIADLYPEWLESKKKKNEPTYIARLETDWDRIYKNSAIVKRPIRDLKVLDVENWLLDVINEIHPTKKDYNNFVTIIKQILILAVRKEIIAVSPYVGVQINRKMLRVPPKKTAGEEAYRDDEVEALISLARKDFQTQPFQRTYKLSALAVIFAFQTGVRVGELGAIRYEDIRDGQVSIHKMVRDKTREVVDHDKSNNPRLIPLTKVALETVAQAKAYQIAHGYPSDGFIFSIDDKPLRSTAINNLLHSYCDSLGILYRPSHKVRKTFASQLIDRTHDANLVAELLGHRDIQTTFNNYVINRNSLDEKRAILESALIG